MLTPEHVRARRVGSELKLVGFDGKVRARGLDLARAYLEIARAGVGQTREDLVRAWSEVAVEPRDRKLAAGLRKLVEDLCAFAADDRIEPRSLRKDLFERAAAARRALREQERFDRAAVVAEAAAAVGLSPADVDELLFADLRDRQRLVRVGAATADEVVDRYPTAAAQAVLLRATSVHARVRSDSAASYRTLFRSIKFRRLLHTIERGDDGGYIIAIDGPMSLFSAGARYGLELALVLPVIQQCTEWSVEAQVLWSKDRRPLAFSLAGSSQDRGVDEAPLADDVAALLERFAGAGSGWNCSVAAEVLEQPGEGLCVPDLRFDHPGTGTVAYLEALGPWSRETVWKRVELVKAGLPHRVIFAVPKKLRVSEEVLDPGLPGQLYVYRGSMSASAVAERLDAMLAHEGPAGAAPPW